MEKNALCLSLFGSQLKAVSLRRGALHGAWEAPAPVDNLSELGDAVEQCAANTGAASRRVALVVAHARLSQQIVEVPPAKGSALDRFLDRRVQSLKLFPEEAAWSSQPALPTKNARALLVHLLPKPVLAQLIQGCAGGARTLVRVIPTTSVLSSQLRELPIKKDETALLAAATGAFTTVVVGRKDGQVCHARIITSNWDTQPDRVALDLARTLGFVNQQAGVTIQSVWLFGTGLEEQTVKLVRALKLPVRVSPVMSTPYYWAEQAGQLNVLNDGNFVSVDAREAPQRRRFAAVAALVLLLVLAAALGVCGFFEAQRRINLGNIASTEAEIAQMQRQIATLEQRDLELKQKRDLVGFVRKQGLAPVPAWMLGYMSEAVSEDLVLTQLRVARVENRWKLNLAGTLHPATNLYATSALHQAVAVLSNNIATGPFRVQMAGDGVHVVEPPQAHFELEGTVR